MANTISLVKTLLSVLSAGIIYFLYRLYSVRRFYKDLPKPPHSLLWGHLKIMGETAAMFPPNSHPQAYYTTIARKYNLEGIWYLDLWPIGPCQVILTDPTLQDEVTVRRPYGQHPMSAAFLAPITGDKVIAVVNGPLWKSLHHAMLPAFSWSSIRNFTSVMVDECEQFCAALDKVAESGEVFSMEEFAMKLIFDVIARIVFNFPLHAQTKGSQTLDDLREMIELGENDLDFAKKFNPWSQITTMLKRRQLQARLDPEIIKQIKERYELLLQNKLAPSTKNPSSILDLMLRDKVQERKEGHTKRLDLSSDEIQILLDNVKGLLIGGHGTTTDSLCYIYMLLSTSSSAMQALIAEHDKYLSPSANETINLLLNSPEKLQELKYTDAVIKEGLRLFPVGFGLRASTSPTATLTHQSVDYPIPPHLALVSNAHDTHYNAEYFPSPATFQPERWLDPDHDIPRSHFRTFSRGARACLGQNLAMNELKIVLVLTVRRYRFECARLSPNVVPRAPWTALDTVFGDAVFQELGLEAKPRGGVWMTVKRNGVD